MTNGLSADEKRRKVFGVGLIKTGTSSLRTALEILGYKALHGGPLEVMTVVQEAIDAGEPMLSRLDSDYDAFADVFGVTHYFYLADAQYPGSRFILTVRDLDDWIASRRRHVLKNQEMKAAGQYRGDLLEIDVDAWVTEYRRHESVVRGYFAGRPDDLLVYDVTGGDGWASLCDFLALPVPEATFPWENRFRPWAEAGGGRPVSGAGPGQREAPGPPPTAISSGRCGVCGHRGDYVVTEAPTREGFECGECHASLRYRLQAAAIAATYGHGEPLAELVAAPSFANLDIYEPGLIGTLRVLLRNLPAYVSSYFWPDVPLGGERDGVLCQDLRRLTFDDESFDLVITSDIFEHIRGPMEAFGEVHRVLRPGGFHIFTVPVKWPLPGVTQSRVDYSGPEDRFLVPAEYHGSPHDPKGSLVYTDFGMDLPEELAQLGFQTTTHHGYKHALTFVSRKPSGQ